MSRVRTSLDHKRIQRLIWLVFTVFVLLGYSLHSVAGSVSYPMVMEAYGTISSPPVILEEGNYSGTTTIYTNSTSAKVNVTAPLFDYVDNDNSDVDSSPDKGTHSNFTAEQYGPDSIYDTLTEGDYGPVVVNNTENFVDNNSSNVDGVADKGTSSNFTAQQDSNVLYNDTLTEANTAGGENTTAKTNAFVAYRDSTTSLNTPKERIWTGESVVWGGQSELVTSGSPVRFTRVAYSPIAARSTEKIVVTLSDDGGLDAYVWNGTSWTVTNNIGLVGITANAYKCFDIAYEKTSGKAVLVYAINSTNTGQDLAYKTWIYGTGWSTEYYIDDTVHATNIQYYWVSLASNPTSGSNEITMVALDFTDSDGNGWVWSGSAWGSIYELDATVSITTEECIAVAYEAQSGRAWTAVGSGSSASTFSMRSQTAGTWNATKDSPNVGGVPNWVTLKADPASNKLMLVSVDGSTDLNIVYYTGSGSWTVNAGTFAEDATVDSNAARCADFAWEISGSVGIIVWGTANNALSARKFVAATPAWSAITPSGSVAGTHPWVQLRTNTRSISGDMRILGAFLNTNFDLGALRWDGTTLTLIGDATFTANTIVTTYECFEIEFMNFGPPIPDNYELDYEFSWTTASFSEANEYLCIRTNSFTGTAENLGVDVWNGAGWTAISDALTASAWNNISISTYLTDATIYFRFIGKTETSDTAQNTWTIECNLIHTWSTQSSYQLDLEVQWTNAGYTRTNEELCIKTGTLGAENLRVDVWNGSTWITVISALLPNVWNNVSVTSYLTSATFTTRYKGGNETNDTVQDSWQIDAALLHVWTESTYDYVLQVVNQVADNWTINLRVYDTSNIVPRLLKTTISFHDGTSSDQIIVNDGSVTQTGGPPYSLTGNATIYISMSNLQATATGTSYLYTYLTIQVPSKSTYTIHIITFEIT